MKIDPANLDFRELYHMTSGVLVPRPIVLISTVGEDGIFNVAPFSNISRPSIKPPLIGVQISTRRDGQKKDTIRNIEFSKDFVVNAVVEDMAEAMNKTSADYTIDVDEFKETGLTPVKAEIVQAPLVAESPVSYECRLVQILEFGEFPRISSFAIGQVVLVHIKDELYVNGEIQEQKLKTIGRLGAKLYCRTTDTFEMERAFTL